MARFVLDDGIFDDEKVVEELEHPGPWLFARMCSLAEKRSGVGRGRAKFLWGKAFATSKTPVTVEQVQGWLDQMADSQLIRFFDVRGERFYILRSYLKHRGYMKDLPKRVLPLPPREILGDWPETLQRLESEYPEEPTRTTGEPPESPRRIPGDAPGGEEERRISKGGGEEGAPRGTPDPADQPPPPASESSAPAAPAPAEPDPAGRAQRAAPVPPAPVPPFVRRLAARARETITPRGGAPPDPDAQEVLDWQALLDREPAPEWERWWVPRLCELLGQIAASERHGPGGSFVVKGPADLLRRSHPKNPQSPLVIVEMLAKFPTRRETPDQRARRERIAWLTERRNELAGARMVEKGTTRLTAKDEQEIKERAEMDWVERTSAGAQQEAAGR